MKVLKISLAVQIFIAMILGVLIGIFYESKLIANNKIIDLIYLMSDIFLRMIKMTVIPIIITNLIISIAKIGNSKKLGSIGLKTFIYFELVTIIAIITGITFANLIHPGKDINFSNLKKIDTINNMLRLKDFEISNLNSIKSLSLIIPNNIFNSLNNSNLLQIIFFSIIFGIGLNNIEIESRNCLIKIFNSISHVMFKITKIIMYYSPIGVFSLTFITVSTFGIESLSFLIRLIFTLYIAIIFFTFVILGTIAKIFNFSILKLINNLKEEILLSFLTASSESVLPKVIKKMEIYGASKEITNFVIPIGYSFNLDGSTLYQSIAIIFISQLYQIELSLSQELILLLTLMVTSKGIAGIPGISFIALLTTLESVGLPLEGAMFILGIDRILDMARTVLNVIGNSLATIIIAKIENQFNINLSK